VHLKLFIIPKKIFFANQIGMQTIWLNHPQGKYYNFTPPTAQQEPRTTTSPLHELLELFQITTVGIPAKPLSK